MKISMIVATGNNGEIGIKGEIPWQIPEDLKFFKKTTLGHHIVMGRKTYESIGRPLPGRTTIIMTKNPDYHVDGCLTVNSIEGAIELAENAGEEELMICGGAHIYKEALPRVDRLYLSKVDYSGDADTYFPDIENYDWKEISKKNYQEPMSWSIQILEK